MRGRLLLIGTGSPVVPHKKSSPRPSRPTYGMPWKLTVSHCGHWSRLRIFKFWRSRAFLGALMTLLETDHGQVSMAELYIRCIKSTCSLNCNFCWREAKQPPPNMGYVLHPTKSTSIDLLMPFFQRPSRATLKIFPFSSVESFL